MTETWENAMKVARRKRAHTGVKHVVRGKYWPNMRRWLYYAVPLGQHTDNWLLRERRQAASKP